MAAVLDPAEIERARAFWSEEEVDRVFDGILEYLDHLKAALKRSTATDGEYVQALRMVECLGCSSFPDQPQDQDSSVVQVVIGSSELLPAEFSHRSTPSSPFNGLSGYTAPPAGQEELLPPLALVQLQYDPHTCCKACLPFLPTMPQSTPLFWGQNPLKVPLLCGFKRLSAMMSLGGGGGAKDNGIGNREDYEGWDVIYKSPCGKSLRNHDDVMVFLLDTKSYDILQVDFFTFNPMVRLDPRVAGSPRRLVQDLSRGTEPTPVELCVDDDGVRPSDFRYRKDRWPHGCFLSREPALFKVCCDCTDGCGDADRCACVAMTTGGRYYRHQRLLDAVPSGIFECGPWCDCVRTLCQNRLVQRGVQVRLQVFQTPDRGWGVRCRDDLDRGTFICIYAGIVLTRVPSPSELPPPKLTRADLPSDDEVEVVTEWLAPPVLEGRSHLLETPPPVSPPTSPPLHVPVIQRHADVAVPLPLEQKSPMASGSISEMTFPSGEQAQEEMVAMMTASEDVGSTKSSGQKSLKRAAMEDEDVCFVDASREGNVSRFINHSCQPNLFLQNVFTDSQDAAFPVVAFFTCRVVSAGTELTWNYDSSAATSLRTQEVECLCGSDGCRGRFSVGESLCEECEAEGHAEDQ
ncbi:histone-lysine N-methyltransferase SETDB2 [Pholidichthys leucotaenia]